MRVFTEEQKFTQLWLHIVLILSFMVPIALVVNEFVNREENDKGAIIGLITVICSLALMYGFIFSLRLKTRIDEMGIHFRFIPFHFKSRMIGWSAIENGYIRNYNALSEFGGWGMKRGKIWRKGKGFAYNIRGNVGLQLKLKNGKEILIGTQKQDEMTRVLQTYNSKFVNSIE